MFSFQSQTAFSQTPFACTVALMRCTIHPDWTPGFLMPSLGELDVRHLGRPSSSLWVNEYCMQSGSRRHRVSQSSTDAIVVGSCCSSPERLSQSVRDPVLISGKMRSRKMSEWRRRECFLYLIVNRSLCT